MSSGTRFPLAKAQSIAEGLVKSFGPACKRLEIVGSIRRETPTAGDIELLAIPKTRELVEGQATLYGDRPKTYYSTLHGHITDLSEDFTRLVPIKPGASEPEDGESWPFDDRWSSKAKWKTAAERPRYYRLWIPLHRIKVDIWLADTRTYGVSKVLRTGSHDWNMGIVGRCARMGRRLHRARLHPTTTSESKAVARLDDGTLIAGHLYTPSERLFFEELRMALLAPQERRTAADVERAAQMWIDGQADDREHGEGHA